MFAKNEVCFWLKWNGYKKDFILRGILMKYQFDLPTPSMIQKAEMTVENNVVMLKFTYCNSETRNVPTEFRYDQNSKRYYVMLGEA